MPGLHHRQDPRGVTAPSLPGWAAPARVSTLHRRALRRWGRGARRAATVRARRAAAAAFYQTGVGFHERLILREILQAFDAAKSFEEPGAAALMLLPVADYAERAADYYDIALALMPDFAEARYNRA